MAKFKEIEIKWDASSVKRLDFNEKVKTFLNKKYKHNKISVAGFDYYYESKDAYVGRHRHSRDHNELTVKARVSKKSTTIRKEINIKLAPDASPMVVQEFMSELGFGKVMPIYKDCDIYFIRDGKYVIDIVWYTVSSPKVKGPDKIFIEIEVHEAPLKKSLKMLDKWKKFLYTNFNISDSDVINQSLYEIYSGNKYRITKGRK
jgi:adenylate cyclase class IV